MTQEAMKQALGALEDFVDVIKYDNEQDDIGRRACCDVLSYNPHSESCKAKQAITAIKAALAQPEQEPVEWGVDWGKDGNSVSIIKRLANGNIEVLAWEYAPHSPQRTWVGLTDEEENEYNYLGPDMHWVIQEIAAKLKEKNT
jgi:hypothetical protein